MKGVSPEDVAEGVYQDLCLLNVEDVWDNSGNTRDEYVEPGEYADEMFGNALEPYLEELKIYRKLSMGEEAKLFCMGSSTFMRTVDGSVPPAKMTLSLPRRSLSKR